ncbi:MAG: hypothetical protein ABEH80_04955 [Halobaculum sp.]|jgi:high-affinity Fe2+/Pb2+ permease
MSDTSGGTDDTNTSPSSREADETSSWLTRDALALAAVLLVGIAGTGVVRRQLGLLGYNNLGRVVFVVGYGGTILLVWFVWLRPLEISGPSGELSYTDETDEE